ncbi:hypothetical protein MOQ_008955, partial [Trypanosoma cruzi marinkellei]
SQQPAVFPSRDCCCWCRADGINQRTDQPRLAGTRLQHHEIWGHVLYRTKSWPSNLFQKHTEKQTKSKENSTQQWPHTETPNHTRHNGNATRQPPAQEKKSQIKCNWNIPAILTAQKNQHAAFVIAFAIHIPNAWHRRYHLSTKKTAASLWCHRAAIRLGGDERDIRRPSTWREKGLHRSVSHDANTPRPVPGVMCGLREEVLGAPLCHTECPAGAVLDWVNGALRGETPSATPDHCAHALPSTPPPHLAIAQPPAHCPKKHTHVKAWQNIPREQSDSH